MKIIDNFLSGINNLFNRNGWTNCRNKIDKIYQFSTKRGYSSVWGTQASGFREIWTFLSSQVLVTCRWPPVHAAGKVGRKDKMKRLYGEIEKMTQSLNPKWGVNAKRRIRKWLLQKPGERMRRLKTKKRLGNLFSALWAVCDMTEIWVLFGLKTKLIHHHFSTSNEKWQRYTARRQKTKAPSDVC